MTKTTNTTNHHRARWAAVGAAVAVSLGAGGIGISHAVVDSPAPMPIYTAISPCRLIDTRADASYHIGPHATLAADQTITVAGWGDVDGDCNLSGASSALELNVTAVGPSQATVLTVFPAGETKPNASNLNPTPGQPPTPNSVTATLNAAGEFSVWNAFGTVDVVVDVVGVYEDHQHTGEDIVDGSLTGADIADESLTGADIDNGTITRVDIADEPGLASNIAPNPNPIGILDTLVAVDLHAPASGHVTVSASAVLDFPADGTTDQVSCVIANGTSNDVTALQQIVTEPVSGALESIQVTRSFPVEAAGEVTYSLICGTPVGDAIASQAFITATYVPTWLGDVSLAPFPFDPDIIDLGL